MRGSVVTRVEIPHREVVEAGGLLEGQRSRSLVAGAFGVVDRLARIAGAPGEREVMSDSARWAAAA